jgi:tripartite-type tricarboxylate transporter receptor subunit TctC
VTEDFVPITLAGRGSPLLVVNPRVPANTFAEFVSYAKAHPGQLSLGSSGVGTPQHLAGELLKKLTGVQMAHVPYKVQPQLLTDLIGGQLQVAIEFPSITVPYIKAGQLRALVIVGPNRKPSLPDVPTAAEVGVPGFNVTAWNGYFAPKGTPPEIVSRLQKELAAIIKAKDFSEWLVSLGSEAVGGTAAEFGAYIQEECPRWAKIAREAGIRLD